MKVCRYFTKNKITYYEDENGDLREARDIPAYPANTNFEVKNGKFHALTKPDTKKAKKCIAAEELFYLTKGILTYEEYKKVLHSCEDAHLKFAKDPFFVFEFIDTDFLRFANHWSVNTEEARFLRARAATFYILRKNEANGHSYMDFDDFLDKASALADYEYVKTLAPALDNCVVENNKISLKEIYDMEKYIATYLKKNSYNEKKDSSDFVPYKECSDEQNVAIKEIVYSDHISVLRGGPGVGKTTTLYNVIREYQKAFPNNSIHLLAPTGKARRRAAESVKGLCPVDTIHLFLGLGHDINKMKRTEIIRTDFIIVDESSMLSSRLGYDMLSRLSPKTKLLFVGDADQLPPIEAGCVFHAMVHGQYIPTHTLTYNFRSDKSITDNAQAINERCDIFKCDENFKMVETSDIASVINSFEGDAILTPYSSAKFDISTININRAVHKKKRGDVPEFAVGEPVIFTQTSYKEGYVNGDVGLVINKYPYGILASVDNNTFLVKDFASVSLNYATTIHKSQGSEYENVLICIPDSPGNFFTKEMLYTAVTRAKKKVTLTGKNLLKNIRIILQNSTVRRTYLNEWLDCNAA